MRQEILADSLPFGLDELRQRFLPIAEQFKMRWAMRIEKTVLARGLRYHIEDRVMLHDNKTIVFR